MMRWDSTRPSSPQVQPGNLSVPVTFKCRPGVIRFCHCTGVKKLRDWVGAQSSVDILRGVEGVLYYYHYYYYCIIIMTILAIFNYII